jgi:hypothetical protein
MGWTAMHRLRGRSNQEFFQEVLFGHQSSTYEILDMATVGGAAYAAVRDRRDQHVWAMVVSISWTRGYVNFRYKEMEEAQIPGYYDCPARILDLLTPTENPLALEWRASCREELAKRAAAPRVRVGDEVRFEAPLTFSNGDVESTFTYQGGSSFRTERGAYSIAHWRRRPHRRVV